MNGQVDVKSLPVYFYVQKINDFNTTTTPIPFDFEVLNVGGAMNSTSGKFTAPRAGTYFFAFNGNAYFPASSYSYFDFHINIYLNGNLLVGGHANELSSTASEEYETVSLQSTVNLQSGDQVWLQITTANSGSYLYGLPTHFSGFLLQENMSQSLTIV